MFTLTTYGSWLRGDARGWVDQGKTYPVNPSLEAHDQAEMKSPSFRFPREKLHHIGEIIGRWLCKDLGQKILAMTVRNWHTHFVVAATRVDFDQIVKHAKDAVRTLLKVDQRIWTEKYDKRFCLNLKSVEDRVRYVERHNEEDGLPARPWKFILEYGEW